MFTVNPIDNALNSLTSGIDTANNSVQTSLNQLTKEADTGMINPASLLKVQLQESIYTTENCPNFVTTITHQNDTIRAN